MSISLPGMGMAYLPKAPVKTIKKPQFSGASHNLAGRVWLPPEDFERLAASMEKCYVGKIPPVLLKAFPDVSPQELLQELDAVAEQLRKTFEPSLALRLGHKKLNLEYVGKGAFGSVYRAKVGGQSFALKLYSDLNEKMVLGVLGELAAGVYLSKYPLKDLARFYCGNPKAGWGLFEFIEPSTVMAERPGRFLSDLPVIADDEAGRNRVRGVRVDYGGVQEKLSLDLFRRLWKHNVSVGNPDRLWELAKILGALNPEDRKPAFDLVMKRPSRIICMVATEQIRFFSDKERIEALIHILGLNFPELTCAVFQQLCEMPGPLRQEVFWRGLTGENPGTQMFLLANLGILSPDARKDLLERVVDTGSLPVCRMMAERLPWVPSVDQRALSERLIATGDPEIKKNILKVSSSLPAGFRRTVESMIKADRDGVLMAFLLRRKTSRTIDS